MPHTCYDTFWGTWTPPLIEVLDNVAHGDALQMDEATYATLMALQREIERATFVETTNIDPHQGNGSTMTDLEQSMLRAVAQKFLAELVNDQSDGAPAPNGHANHMPGWMKKSGQAEQAPVDALAALDGVLGRIRNALGSP
jgi:hypothetical protein